MTPTVNSANPEGRILKGNWALKACFKLIFEGQYLHNYVRYEKIVKYENVLHDQYFSKK